MSDKTINNLISKEKQVFLSNVENYKRIISCRKVQINSDAVEHNYADYGDSEEIEFSANEDVISLLTTVISNQNSIMESLKHLETRMTNLEQNSNDIMNQRCEALAQNKMVRECKVLIKRVHQSMCRMTGETDDGTAIEIMSTLPISTIDACLEVEEKLKINEYEMAMKIQIYKLKGSSGTLDDVLRSLFSDDFTSQYNIDGKFGKKSFMQMTLIHKTLFDVFRKEGQYQYDKMVRKYLGMSHNRHRQRQHHEAKKAKIDI